MNLPRARSRHAVLAHACNIISVDFEENFPAHRSVRLPEKGKSSRHIEVRKWLRRMQMTYSESQGSGRPEDLGGGRPLSAGAEEIPIQEIMLFARNDANDTWSALGLEAVSQPKIDYGRTSEYLNDPDAPYATTNPETGKITLNKHLRGKWTKPQFAQALLVELGNYKNRETLKGVQGKVKSYTTADAYAREIELIEYASFIIVCAASHSAGSPLHPSIWSAVPSSFEAYYISPKAQGHVDAYKEEWKAAQ
jgi:hypothetical protein